MAIQSAVTRWAALGLSGGLLVVAVACRAAPVATSVAVKRTPRPPTVAATTAVIAAANAESAGTAPPSDSVLSATAAPAPLATHPGIAYQFAVDQERWQLKAADGVIGAEVLLNGCKLAVRSVLRPVRPNLTEFAMPSLMPAPGNEWVALEILIGKTDGECGAANPQYSARVFDRDGISYPTIVLHRDLGFPAAAYIVPGIALVGRIYFEVPAAATLVAMQWNWYPDRFVTQIDLGQ